MKTRFIKSPMLYREMSLDRAKLDKDARTLEIAFSSEFPVERHFGVEVLDHGSGSAILNRLHRGAPLLLEHNLKDQVGVVESARIDTDRVGRAVVRFGKSARAQEIFTDVEDGIRTSVSVGYRAHKMVKEKDTGGMETFRVVSWEPLEVSIVACPADPHVGVGRAARDGKEDNEIEVEEPEAPTPPKENRMDPVPNNPPPPQPDAAMLERVRVEATQAEQQRVSEINGLANHWRARCPEIDKAATDHIAAGTPVAEFRKVTLGLIGNAGNALRTPPPEATMGMSDKDIRQYSFARAILGASGEGGPFVGLEKEVHDEGTKRAKAQGAQLNGNLFIPYDVLKSQRADPETFERAQMLARNQVVGTASLGGNLVETKLLAGSFIDILRNEMVVARLGATMLTGLVGNIAIPRQATQQAAVWMASETATAASADITFDQVLLSPKCLQAIRTYSKQLLVQSTPDIDTLVRNDLAVSMAIAIDLAALHGTGSNGQPTGIAATSGVGSVLAGNGTNGADPSWSDIVELETDVAVANAATGSLAYLTSAAGRGFLKQIPQSTVVGFSWNWQPWVGTPPVPGAGLLNGYPAYVSNQVVSGATVGSSAGNASFMFFGNWADLLIGSWGGLDILTDPYTLMTTRMIRVSAVQFVDVAVRRPQSFSVLSDMETS